MTTLGKDGGANVKVGDYSACYKPANGKEPDRVDVWCGVVWMGQWYWIPQMGIADRRQPADLKKSKLPETDATVLGKIAAALRARGV